MFAYPMMRLLINQQPLPDKNHDHALTGSLNKDCANHPSSPLRVNGDCTHQFIEMMCQEAGLLTGIGSYFDFASIVGFITKRCS